MANTRGPKRQGPGRRPWLVTQAQFQPLGPTAIQPQAPEYVTGVHAQAVMDYQIAASQRVFSPLIIPAPAGNPFAFIFTTQDGTPLQGNGSRTFAPSVLPPGQPPPFPEVLLTVRAEWDNNASITFPSVVFRQFPMPAMLNTAQDASAHWLNASQVFRQFQQPVAAQLARTILTVQEQTRQQVAGTVFAPFPPAPIVIGPFLQTLLTRQDPLPYDLQIAASQAVFNSAAFSIPIPPPPVTPQAGGSVPGHTGGKRKRKKDSGPYMREDQVFGEEYPISPFLGQLKSARDLGKASALAKPSIDHSDAIRMLMRELL